MIRWGKRNWIGRYIFVLRQNVWYGSGKTVVEKAVFDDKVVAVKKYNFEEKYCFNTFIREIHILQLIKYWRKEKVLIEMFGVTRVKKDDDESWWCELMDIKSQVVNCQK